VGSIPDVLIAICRCYIPSGRNMTLGFTQPLTVMSTRNISGGWGGEAGHVVKAAGA